MTDNKRCGECGEPVGEPWRVRPDDDIVYHGQCLLAVICAGPAHKRRAS